MLDLTGVDIGAVIHAAAAKVTPVDADTMPLIDSAASNVLKKVTWANIKATLKTYFDTLYNLYVHPNHTGDVTSVADGATTIAADAVTNAKAANMAADTIKGRANGAGTGDPTDLTATQVRTIINVANGADVTGTAITALATKTTPVDADAVVITDSAASDAPKRTLWSNIKATLKTYFDTLYVALTGDQTVAGVKTFSSGIKVETIDAIDGDGIQIRDDAGNVAIQVLDLGKLVLVGANTYTEPFSGFSAQGNYMVVVRQAASVSANAPFAGFLFSNNQTGTAHNIAQLMFMNEAIGATEKRVAQILVQTDGATDDGRVIIRTLNSGVTKDNLTLSSSGLATFSDYVNWAGQKRVSTQFDKTNTTLATVTGLSVSVEAGMTYNFRATLHVTCTALGGMKVAVAGTATATAIIYHIEAMKTTSTTNDISARHVVMGGTSGIANDTGYFVTIEGTITVNAAGTLLCQFAQQASSGVSSVLIGSTFIVSQLA
jgi:hypothetical protein